MKKEHLHQINQFMLENADVAAHESDHIYRVLNQALIIAKDYDINEDVLVAACLLHDVGRPAQLSNPNICHAKIGSEMAYKFLKNLGWNDEDCQQVKHCVLTHRFSNDLQPETIEAKILFDADKLDLCGAMAIGRTILYAGKMNYPLDEFLTHYNQKLIKLYDLFYTEKGKEIAAEGKTLLTMFYEALERQLSQSAAQEWFNTAESI